jgi:hypothetical protein
VWIHGPQPVEFTSAEQLRGALEADRGRVRLIAAQLIPGPNVVLAKLDGLRQVEAVRTTADEWPGVLGRDGFVWTRVPAVDARGAPGPDGIVRLWALSEVLRIGPGRVATDLAASYRLVTPVSGAVVLERAEQYKAFGLDPGAGLGAVPEPATIALVGAGLAILLWRRHRRTC